MPLIFEHHINDSTRLGLWHITEDESFFTVPLHRAITHPHKRLQHLAGRFLLPTLVPGFPAAEIAIANTRKPYLPAEQYHFSISHCSTFAAAIVSSEFRVGVDVEVITPRLENIRSKFLHRDEQRFVNTIPAHLRLTVLGILWSAKEAIYKWYGLGEVDFSEMIRTFPFAPADAGVIDAAFMKNDFERKLMVHFKLLNDLCLVWVVSV